MFLGAVPVGADVRVSTREQAYRVGGTTAGGLVSYMKNFPFPGDGGAAVANIRPSYALSVRTNDQGGICRASVDLRVNFVMTLPQATSQSALSGGARSAWNGFVAFARRHEETHRAAYVQCANAFAAKAERLTSKAGCMALSANIRSMLEAEKAACDRQQKGFDRQQYRAVLGLSLFQMAKYAGPGRKPAHVAAKSGPSVSMAGPR
jgi:predicted secreted Zn-dependent protease